LTAPTCFSDKLPSSRRYNTDIQNQHYQFTYTVLSVPH